MSDLRLRVSVDGFNLKFDRGTGISSYTRSLGQTLSGLGCLVDGIFDKRVDRSPTGSPLSEIQFFDARPPRLSSPGRWLEHLGPLLTAPAFWHRPRLAEIATGDIVVKRPFAEQIAGFDRLLNYPDLFERAMIHFFLFRRLLTVRAPSKIDIAYWTSPIPIRLAGARNVYTLHDLIPLKLPYTTINNKKTYYRLCRTIGHAADLILTVSETSRNDILELLGVPEPKVINTYQSHALSRSAIEAPMAEVESVLAGRFGLQAGDYFLTVGAIEPKKNLARTVEAYADTGLQLPLVIAGPLGWQYQGDLQLIQSVNESRPALSGRDQSIGPGALIRRVDYVSQRNLVFLMRGARALLFPSLYEGFGLPVLEAMSLGCPVITSKGGALGEVAGDAAFLVDPYDVGEMRRAILQVAEDDDLIERLRAAGHRQAARFERGQFAARIETVLASLRDRNS